MRFIVRFLTISAGILWGSVALSAPQSSDPGSNTPLPKAAPSEAQRGAPITYRPGAKVCLAEAVYFESWGTSARAAHAVAHVILNRREHDEFPETVCGVVADGCQFSYRCDGKPENLTDAEERERAFRAAEAVLNGRAGDPTDGALFFHSEAISPGWLKTLDRTAEIGGNIFYR